MKDLTVGKEGKLILNFALPLLLSSFFQQLYSFVDSIIVGRFIGNEALTAIGTSMPIIFGLISLIIGVAIGGMIIISQFYGAKDYDNLRKTIDTLFIFLFFSAIVISSIGFLFHKTILEWVNIQPGAEEMASTYLNIYLAGLIMFFGFNGISAVLRGMGDSKTPLYFMIIATLTNIALDVLFIVVLKTGVAGAALATIISQGGAFISAVIYLNRNHEILSIHITKLKFDREIFFKSLRISLPSGFQHTFVAVGMAALYSIVNRFQEPVPSAYSAAGRIDMLALLPAMAFSQALSTFTGQNIGAGKLSRVKKGLLSTLFMSSVTCIIISLGIIIFGEELVGLFISKNVEVNESFIKIGKEYLIIVSSFYLLFNTMFTFNGVIRGAGETLVPMFITLFALWFIRIPLAAILSTPERLSEKGIWIAIPVGWLIGMFFSVVYYLSGKWKGKSITSSG